MGMLNLLAERVVHQVVNAELVAYCPTMDMIALALADDQVHVYRLNGQRVFVVTGKHSAGKVRGLKWKPNGQVLAVAFSNHSLTLTNAQTGKAVHQINCSVYSASQVCCLGWGINFTDVKAIREQLQSSKLTLDDMLSQGQQAYSRDTLPDLPMELAFLDIEGALPKLGTLSMSGKEDEVFSSRASLDTLLHPTKQDCAELADVLLTGFEDGTIHLSIYDFFEIGSFQLPGSKPLLHCSHPYSTTHSLLVSTRKSDHDQVQLIPLDLRLISNAERYLSLLASKSTQLHNLIRYMHQVQNQLISEFKASQDLPNRFIRNVEEALQEKSGCGWIHAAYHLAVTGNCYPPVKEWLVEELGERGHKRWEKAATTGYEHVRRLTHENLLPALERFSVLLCRLRGLSKFQDSNIALGLSPQELDNILDTVNCVKLVSHHILKAACAELRQFSAFSAWLHQEIELQAVDSASASAQETAEKESILDHAQILDYIQGAMTKSRLADFLEADPADSRALHLDLGANGAALYEVYRREIRNDGKQSAAGKRLPGLHALMDHLSSLCSVMFSTIAAKQRRNVRFAAPVNLGRDVSKCMDMRALVEQLGANTIYVTYIVKGPSSTQNIIQIFRIVSKIENGISSTQSVERATIRGIDARVEDVKFVDDAVLMIAVSGQTLSRLLGIPYRNTEQFVNALRYVPVDDKDVESESSSADALDLTDMDMMNEYERHTFPAGKSWTPARLEINGRKGRRVICILAEDLIRYRLYDLDSAAPEAME